jgi:isopentenyl phosphate kinase
LPHNWSFDLYRKGVTTLSDARLSESNYLTGSVNGYVKKIRYDSFIFDIKAKDRILICTDGIWGLFEHNELEKEIGDAKSSHGTGGMQSKIEAATIAKEGKIETWIVNGLEDNFILKAINNENRFTKII